MSDPVDLMLADLIDAYPRAKIGQPTLAVYRAHLSDLRGFDLAALAADLIRTRDYFPTVAEIRRAAAERALKLPTPEEALALVARGPGVCPHPVRDVVRELGGFAAFRANEHPASWRRQFLDLYVDRRNRELTAAARGQMDRLLPPGETHPAKEPSHDGA